jgi:hypothetical protein
MVNLSIEETSGVDHPAHLHEGWLVMKAASSDDVEKATRPMRTDDGVEYPAEAYAYVPDAESPSTWKLRLWESPAKKITARQVGMAVAALGPGFRGQKVEIPSGDLASVKAKVRSAWSEANPDREEDEMPPILKATEEVLMEKQDEQKDVEMDVEKADKPSYEDLAAQLEKANMRIAEMEKEMGAMKKPKKAAEGDMEEDEDLPEFLRKEAPEPVRKAFESLQKAAADAKAQAEAAEAELRKERAERADAEAIVKARSAYANLGLDPEQVGPALRRLADSDADLAKSVEDVLTAANAKVESADIFSEIGKSARPAGTAYEKAEAMAKAAVADGKSATFEQALSDVFTSDGDLYMSYLAEQGK